MSDTSVIERLSLDFEARQIVWSLSKFALAVDRPAYGGSYHTSAHRDMVYNVAAPHANCSAFGFLFHW